MIHLAKEIGIDPSLVSRLASFNEKERAKTQKLTAKCLAGDFSCLQKENHIIRLAVILCCALDARDRYREKGISDSVFLDTMSDIKIWCENNGNKGLKNFGWLKNHVRLELFRLGRLQFQLYECKNRTLLYNKLPFDYGERLLSVHIPQGEKLDTARCREAFLTAEKFFAKYFPDYKFRWYFCESWLLFECNRDFMAQESNILAFASLFEHSYSMKIDAQAIERIFGKRQIFKRKYPEKTSLQKLAKKYVLSGKRLGVGVGVIDRNSLTTENK